MPAGMITKPVAVVLAWDLGLGIITTNNLSKQHQSHHNLKGDKGN